MTSKGDAPREAAIANRPPASALLLMLAFAFQPLSSSGRSHERSISGYTGTAQSSAQAPKGDGVIVGVVVNEQYEPVGGAIVQAFSPATVSQAHEPTIPPVTRSSGSASTDAEGRFQISGLPLGEYLLAATQSPLFPSGGPVPAQLYGATFYPSTLDEQQALSVSAFNHAASTVQIQLVPVRGVRVSGSVVSPSGRSTEGLDVRLFHRFGGFGAESNVSRVGAKGAFVIPRVPRGWYRLTIGPRKSQAGDGDNDFVDKILDVQDRDIDGLSLLLGPSASISGRIVAEPAESIPSPISLRVNASPQLSASRSMASNVAADWTFRMTGLSGSYQFTVSANQAPGVIATRITVDGTPASSGTAVELAGGAHEVVVSVAARESLDTTVDTTLSSAALVERFKSEKVFWRQFALAREIVERHDATVLPSLVPWLTDADRHVRGNVALIVGGLGDSRGLQVITDILSDRSDRPPGQGIAIASNDLRYHVERQISADRYYAVHLLGDLRDPRAVPTLVALLKDPETSAIVPWSLGQIGDTRAIGPLLEALDDGSPTMRVLTIYALETLHAKEAIPRLSSLLDDQRTSNFGAQVSVADAARAAIAKLK